MPRLVIEQKWIPGQLDIEDGGSAKIYHIEAPENDTGVFVRLQSWDDNKVHETFRQFQGKALRVTIETLD